MSETKFTPGPWRWELNRKGKRVQLCGGCSRFDLTVMDFVRWGMGGAQPRLLKQWEPNGMMLLDNAPMFGKDVPGREHHSDWFQTLDHPDTHLIASAPDLYAALEEMVGAIGRINFSDVVGRAQAALAKARGETA